MEQTVQSNKCSDSEKGTKRKLKIQDEQCPSVKLFKVDEKKGGAEISKTGARRDESLFDLSYDKEASRSAVAGITLKRKYSPILSISGPSKKSRYPITPGIKAISSIIRYGEDHDDVRLSILFHD
ncbi:uncharacterized protein LOC127710708 [Mytilus californianus]|uniref:uncharacterized protein LOC127710708 n=1 Tax=Mytilus californianus TaxID=6549 RepID=UPI002247D81D|nr:uncharacterized protein LOC127710708 [Mytilus californianus]